MEETYCRNLQSRGHNSVKQTSTEDSQEVSGYVVTEKGIAVVESHWYWNNQDPQEHHAWTKIRFVWEGRLRVLEEPFYRYPLSLIRAAGRFADAISKGFY